MAGERDLEFVLRFKNEARKNLQQAKKNFKEFGKEVERSEKDLQDFNRQSKKSNASLKKIGTQAKFAGAAIGTAFVLAIRSGLELERSLSRIELLTVANTEQVAQYRNEIGRISKDVARGPQELADALFVINSAGLTGDSALRALETSSKAAALGLGETNDLARAAAAAVFTFGEETINSDKALAVITKTAEQGNFEISQLSGSIGRILPDAKNAGVGFDQIGAGIAVLTKGGIPAAQAIDSLRAALRNIATPSEQGQKVMEQYGFTVEDIQKDISEAGLLGALLKLNRRLGGNSIEWRKLLGDAQAVNAVSSLLNKDTLPSTIQTFAELGNVVETDVSDRFEKFAKTDVFILDQAMTEIKAAFVDFGVRVLPIVADGIEEVRNIMGQLAIFFDIVGSQTVKLGGVTITVIDTMSAGWDQLKNNIGLVRDSIVLAYLDIKGLLKGGLSDVEKIARSDLLKDIKVASNRSIGDSAADVFVEQVNRLTREGGLTLEEAIRRVENGRTDVPVRVVTEDGKTVPEKVTELQKLLQDLAANDPGFIASTPGGDGEADQAQQKRLKARQDEINKIRVQTEAVKVLLSGEERSLEIAELRIELAQAATEQERILIQQQIDAVRAYDNVNKALERNQRVQDEIADAVGDTFRGILTGSDSAGDAVRKLADRFAELAIEIAIIEPLMEGIRGGLGGSSSGGGFGIIGSLFSLFSAKGNVFKNGTPQKFFASGGVVNSPMAFPLGGSGGGVGVAGEAGPEAILPLQRLSNGQLGVQSTSANGGGVYLDYKPTFQFNFEDGGSGNLDPKQTQAFGRILDDEVKKKVHEVLQRERQPGGLLSTGRRATV